MRDGGRVSAHERAHQTVLQISLEVAPLQARSPDASAPKLAMVTIRTSRGPKPLSDVEATLRGRRRNVACKRAST